MFRFKALQKMREPDELDSASLLAAPRGWIAVFVIMFVTAGALVWSFVGTLTVSVSSPGLLTYPAGTTVVQSPVQGVVESVGVELGAMVSAQQPLARVTTDSGTAAITSPFSGRVVGLAVSQAQLVERGSAVASVERIDTPGEPMVAMLFVAEQDAQSLRPGQSVDVSVPTAPSASYGLLRGMVSSVSEYPLTAEQVALLVGGELAARAYTRAAAPHLVLVELRQDRSTASGYAWTTTSGPPGPLRSQVPVTATVDVATQRPITLLFGR